MEVNFSIDFILGNRGGVKSSTSDESTEDLTKSHTIQRKPTNERKDDQTGSFRKPQSPFFSFRQAIVSDVFGSMIPYKFCPTKCYERFRSTPHWQQFVACNACHWYQCNEAMNSMEKATNSSVESESISYPHKTRISINVNKLERTAKTKSKPKSSQKKWKQEKSKAPSKEKRCRIGRRLFRGSQILELEQVFAKKSYLSRTERTELAKKINLTECQIKTWFQNRRTKEKRRGSNSIDIDDVVDFDDVTSDEPYRPQFLRTPGHGIQTEPTYGPPDKYLKAAIVDFLNRKSKEEKDGVGNSAKLE